MLARMQFCVNFPRTIALTRRKPKIENEMALNFPVPRFFLAKFIQNML